MFMAPVHRYTKPTLQRFGTFRELTLQGFGFVADGGLIIGADGSTSPAGDDPAASR